MNMYEILYYLNECNKQKEQKEVETYIFTNVVNSGAVNDANKQSTL